MGFLKKLMREIARPIRPDGQVVHVVQEESPAPIRPIVSVVASAGTLGSVLAVAIQIQVPTFLPETPRNLPVD